MGLTAFHRFQDLAREENVVFYYTGYFSQAVVSAMADALRQRLNCSAATNVTRRKLFSVFIEMAQNVVHYSADPLTASDDDDKEMRRGALWVGEKGDHFYVVCANPIARDAQTRLLDKLEPLRSMTLDEIKQRYKEKLRCEGEAGSKGAGLGFLTVARDASEPIEFDFVDEPGSATTLFYLKATL